MNFDLITPASQLIFHFYAQCFAFLYEEMKYELQHLFRIIENEDFSDDDLVFLDQILAILNLVQGEEIKDLRDEYVALFASQSLADPRCPMIASDFFRLTLQKYDSLDMEEFILESGIPVNPDEPVDSIINYLTYFSLLCEDYLTGAENADQLILVYKNHLLRWVPHFCDALYRAAGLSFYKELAIGLKEYILSYIDS